MRTNRPSPVVARRFARRFSALRAFEIRCERVRVWSRETPNLGDREAMLDRRVEPTRAAVRFWRALAVSNRA